MVLGIFPGTAAPAGAVMPPMLVAMSPLIVIRYRYSWPGWKW